MVCLEVFLQADGWVGDLSDAGFKVQKMMNENAANARMKTLEMIE